MKIRVSGTTRPQLDWLVAKVMGFEAVTRGRLGSAYCWDAWGRPIEFLPTTDWNIGGPILTEARISRTIDHSGLWVAYWTDGYGEGDDTNKWMQCDRSELVAGLRCLVASKLGIEVEVPDELGGAL